MHLTELAFAELYHETYPTLRKYAVQKFGTAFADEAVSLAYQNFWTKRDEWIETNSNFPLGILRSLVWRRATDLYRSAKVNPCSSFNENVLNLSNHYDSQDHISHDLDLEEHSLPLDSSYLHQEIRLAVTSLPHPQAEVVNLCYFQGLTCVEAAAHLRCPLGTIKARLAYAYAKLKPLLAHAISRSNTFRNS